MNLRPEPIKPGHSPHPKMWDRLESIYGVAAVARALELSHHNEENRQHPLVELETRGQAKT